MAKYKAFNVHDLYPADYVFPWDKFESDPEGYQFTSEDIAYANAMELEEYELRTPMTPYEKRALRRWVAAGHSVRETPPSRYPCAYPSHPATGNWMQLRKGCPKSRSSLIFGSTRVSRLKHRKNGNRGRKMNLFTARRRKQPAKRSGCFKDNSATSGCSWPRKDSMKMQMPLLKVTWPSQHHSKMSGKCPASMMI